MRIDVAATPDGLEPAAVAASTVLVIGIALAVMGFRALRGPDRDRPHRTRGLRLLGTGVAATAAGVVLGFTHTGT